MGFSKSVREAPSLQVSGTIKFQAMSSRIFNSFEPPPRRHHSDATRRRRVDVVADCVSTDPVSYSSPHLSPASPSPQSPSREIPDPQHLQADVQLEQDSTDKVTPITEELAYALPSQNAYTQHLPDEPMSDAVDNVDEMQSPLKSDSPFALGASASLLPLPPKTDMDMVLSIEPSDTGTTTNVPKALDILGSSLKERPLDPISSSELKSQVSLEQGEQEQACAGAVHSEAADAEDTRALAEDALRFILSPSPPAQPPDSRLAESSAIIIGTEDEPTPDTKQFSNDPVEVSSSPGPRLLDVEKPSLDPAVDKDVSEIDSKMVRPNSTTPVPSEAIGIRDTLASLEMPADSSLNQEKGPEQSQRGSPASNTIELEASLVIEENQNNYPFQEQSTIPRLLSPVLSNCKSSGDQNSLPVASEKSLSPTGQPAPRTCAGMSTSASDCLEPERHPSLSPTLNSKRPTLPVISPSSPDGNQYVMYTPPRRTLAERPPTPMHPGHKFKVSSRKKSGTESTVKQQTDQRERMSNASVLLRDGDKKEMSNTVDIYNFPSPIECESPSGFSLGASEKYVSDAKPVAVSDIELVNDTGSNSVIESHTRLLAGSDAVDIGDNNEKLSMARNDPDLRQEEQEPQMFRKDRKKEAGAYQQFQPAQPSASRDEPLHTASDIDIVDHDNGSHGRSFDGSSHSGPREKCPRSRSSRTFSASRLTNKCPDSPGNPIVDIDDYSDDQKYSSPVYLLSDNDDEDEKGDSEVEFVGQVAATDTVSDKVKHSLEHLHLENVIVTIPKFTRCSPPLADDIAVLKAMEEFLQIERSRRKKDLSILTAIRGNILVIAGSFKRARRLYAFFQKHSALRVAIYGSNRSYRRRRSRAHSACLDDVIDSVDIVVSYDRMVLADAGNNCANLRNVSLLVFDSVEYAWRRGHPMAMLMRDHYRSLGEQQRPRILAISRQNIANGQKAPIEYNLFAKFESESAGNVKWKSCLGKGSRLSEFDLLDVEYLDFRRGGSDMQIEFGWKPSCTARVKDRRGFSAIDSVVDEVGPLGVQLYRRRIVQKKRRKLSGQGWDGMRQSQKGHGDKCATLGVTQKMLSLLNELYEAYRASTELDSLMAIVHAGNSAVTFAVSEVIKSVPVFEGLEVSAALGKGTETEVGSSSAVDAFELRHLQGHDTDDDEVSTFIAGDINILIVSNRFTSQKDNRRPLPSCSLVIRFDGSSPNPKIDGGGGRCRVVVFREVQTLKNIESKETVINLEQDGQKELDESCTLERSNNKGTAILDPNGNVPTQENTPLIDIPTMDLTASNDPGKTRKSNTKGSVSCEAVKQTDSRKEYRNETLPAEVFHCKPPRSLLGPDLEVCERGSLYRILLFCGDQKHYTFPLVDATRIGVEDYAIVLSEKLDNNDTIVSLKDVANGTGNGTAVKGHTKLDYQGSITFTAERLAMAREYNTILFSLTDHTFEPSKFEWNVTSERGRKKKDDPASSSFLRRYLILPVVSCDSDNVEETQPGTDSELLDFEKVNGASEGRKAKLSTYFESNKRSYPTIHNHVKVDWKSVELVLELRDREKHDTECQLRNSYSPSKFHELEGKLLFSSLPNEIMVLSGRLQYDSTPLSLVRRDRKFPLNDDGTFIPHEDLTHLIAITATEDTIRKQAEATGIVKDADVIDVDTLESPLKGGKSNGAKPKPSDGNNKMQVRWCEKRQQLILVLNDEVNEKEQIQLFDCQRNVMKKRTVWTGKVCYEMEHYYNRFYRHKIKHLNQPLLITSRPQKATFDDFLDILRGDDVIDVCERLAKRGANSRLVVPELSRVYPLSIGSVFLPAVLFYIEQHLSICEMRNVFAPSLGGKPDFSLMIRAVTANYVNCTMNYERMEFLGDSLLKLSCTTRLITQHTHESEGTLSKLRSTIIANFSLYRASKKLGLYNYLRFHTETVQEWMPPGTDKRGKGRRVQMKALADVVEALCGAYFLFGTRKTSSTRNKRVKLDGLAKGSSSDDYEEDSEAEWLSSSEMEDEGTSERMDMVNDDASLKRKRTHTQMMDSQAQLTGTSVHKGYLVGCKFLECCSVLEGKEPSHRDILLAGIHALHPPNSAPPTEVTLRAFPPDRRLTHPEKPWDQHLGVLENMIGYKFKRRHLLMCALTHGSYVKSNGQDTPDTETFERLEFLGDAVADFCVVCHLYEKHPELGPGELTNLKGNIVRNESFARITVTRGFYKYLYHSSAQVAGEIDNFIQSMPQDLTQGGSGGQCELKRDLGEVAAPKVLSDIFEAIIGAIFVDSGLPQAWKACMLLLQDALRINGDPDREDLHPCDELVDMVTRVWKLSSEWPRFVVARGGGSTQGKLCTVFIMGRKIATGRGTTAKRAKLTAAISALRLLQDEDVTSHGAKLLKELKEESLRRRVAQRREGQ